MADDFFEDVFNNVLRAPVFGGETLMKTDIAENDGRYYLDIELPGYSKEDVKISLYNGDLTIEAAGKSETKPGKLLRQERYRGNCSRTFYVGTALKETDIHASFKDGILTVDFPTEQKKQEEEKKYIEIL
jgi:HSP20 family molecular chaperone IbpA